MRPLPNHPTGPALQKPLTNKFISSLTSTNCPLNLNGAAEISLVQAQSPEVCIAAAAIKARPCGWSSLAAKAPQLDREGLPRRAHLAQFASKTNSTWSAGVLPVDKKDLDPRPRHKRPSARSSGADRPHRKKAAGDIGGVGSSPNPVFHLAGAKPVRRKTPCHQDSQDHGSCSVEAQHDVKSGPGQARQA